MATRFHEPALEKELIERYQPMARGRRDGANGRPITASDPNEWEQKIISDFRHGVSSFCRRFNDQQTDCVTRFLSSMQRYRSLHAEVRKLGEEIGQDERRIRDRSADVWERFLRIILLIDLIQGRAISNKKKKFRRAEKEYQDAFTELNDIYGHWRKYYGAHQREIEQLGSHYVKVVNLYRRNYEESSGQAYPGGFFTGTELLAHDPCQCEESDTFQNWFHEANRTVTKQTNE